ncbi:hypothetical protein F5051DRAFT_447170 [Lentinula edodes]|nr:hypothetical protein F5051DRAFT_447170 [Lentinula edodes]
MLFQVPSQLLRICLLSFAAFFIATTVVANPLPVPTRRRVGTESKQKETVSELWFGRVHSTGQWIISKETYQAGEVAVLGVGNWAAFRMVTAVNGEKVASRKIITIFDLPSNDMLGEGKKYVKSLGGKVNFGIEGDLHVKTFHQALQAGLKNIAYIEREIKGHLHLDTEYISGALLVIDRIGLFEPGAKKEVSTSWDTVMGAYEIMRYAHHLQST